MLFEERLFQNGFEGGKTWSFVERFWERIPGHWSYVSESTLSILVELDVCNSYETSVCRTQRGGKVDRQRKDQTSRQEHMNLCFDSTGWKYCTKS